MSNVIEVNPYQDENGEPIRGKLKLFLDWEREKELLRRNNLPPEDIKRLEATENHLSLKMNS